jgi:hypothetical protein
MLAYLVVILCFFGVPAFFIGLAFWYLLAPAKPTLAELLALKHPAIPAGEMRSVPEISCFTISAGTSSK